MKNLYICLFLVLCTTVYAQDTTWVQTFTFDSITARRANFQFPAELDTMRFEKVQMYYKLKCSPLTTWDQYNCGEWDYLTYTRVFDHTGAFDSVAQNGSRYLSNWASPNQIQFNPWPTPQADVQQKTEKNRNAVNSTFLSVTNGSITSSVPFQTNLHGQRYQFLIKASELIASGVQPGAIESLKLNVAATGSNGAILNPSIRIMPSNDLVLQSLQEGNFIQVYNASRAINSTLPPLQTGWAEFVFFQPYQWDGTSNLIFEFTFDNDEVAAAPTTFLCEQTSTDLAITYSGRNGQLLFSGTNYTMSEYADVNVGSAFTIEFWAKGGSTQGTNTTFLEATDTAGHRVLNIHLPWSNNNIYFDAGDETGYDRINKAATPAELDGTWNHWAFVKNQASGEMFIYKNGQLWHSGTGLTREVGFIHRLIIGANADQGLKWNGSIDELRLYNAALSAATIAAHYQKKIDPSHPNWGQLLVYHDFDETKFARDLSVNQLKLMPSESGMIKFSSELVAGIQQVNLRPSLQLTQTPNTQAVFVNLVSKKVLEEPIVIFEQQPLFRHFEIVNSWIGVPSGTTDTYDVNGNLLSSIPFTGTSTLTNQAIIVYNPPYEIIHDVEIARNITPYGIQFDLGPTGFTWIYDVTDYQQYLKGLVDLAAHNTQELIDLKFAFIKGIPPRDVLKREPIWADFKSYNYGQMAADAVLQETPIVLDTAAEMFKIKTRMSGHGQVGDYACCEWVANQHQLKVDGIPRFNWSIWDAMGCGDNPNIGQGGTWPYAREGWCPGDKVKEFEFELTPYVQPGDTVNLDYAVNDVPATDPGQAGGNYIAAYDLISYTAPNFQNDAAIVDVLNPNNYEYYSKWNPTCQNPRIILKNTGANPLTSCRIFCWLDYGSNLVYDWTGNLGFLEQEVVEIPVTDMNWWAEQDSSYTFTTWVADVNGIIGPDQYNQNSLVTTKYDAPERIDGPFFVWLTTNNKAEENSWRLLDHAGNVLFERDSMQNTAQYKDTFDLAPGCYSIIIEDTDHDGLSFWYSAQVEGETAGQMRLRHVGGSYIEFFPGDFGRYHRYDFTVGFTLDVPEIELGHEISVFPNPGAGLTTIELKGAVQGQATLQIKDLSGRVLYTEAMNASADFAESFVDISSFASGTYLIQIEAAGRAYTSTLLRR
ncbi:MAG: hypothetical protein RLZZ301_217 [Bacteroidota bacterium]